MAKVKNILFLDPSASHLAYCIAELTDKDLYIKAVGMLWTKGSWSRGQRFLYMDTSLDALVEGVLSDHVVQEAVTEAYFVNFKQKSGIAVIPTINGFVEKACAKHKVAYSELSASSWRGILKIKKKDGDFKQPTKEMVETYIGKVPAELTSNITKSLRATPHDVTDVLGIAIATAKQKGIDKITLANAAFNPHSIIERLNKLSKEI